MDAKEMERKTCRKGNPSALGAAIAPCVHLRSSYDDVVVSSAQSLLN